MTSRSDAEVVLPSGHTGSSLFHTLLGEAIARFPAALSGVGLPESAGAFKRDYGLLLARFEAARVGSTERLPIASFLLRRTLELVRFGSSVQSMPLGEALAEPCAPPSLTESRLTGPAGLKLAVPFQGKTYTGRAVHELVDRLYEAQQLTEAARAGLRWIVEYAAARGDRLDLRGERFALLGAGAEVASTRLLLHAGADVLWIDRSEPTAALHDLNDLAGTITVCHGASDLLTQPRAIASALRAFCEQGPAHVGLFAYAPGASQEWRVGAAMNAIVATLEPAHVRSIAMLVSPTAPAVLSPACLRAGERRYLAAPSWQRLLERMSGLERPGHVEQRGVRVSLSTIAQQGASYQAAQYLSKIVAAESYATQGPRLAEPCHPVTVSANVAGITRTRSLRHPLFEAAFSGADAFSVCIFEPETTRMLSGLLMLHDLLNPGAPGAAALTSLDPREKVAGLRAQRIHGGVHTLPFAFEGVVRAAAMAGFAQQPSLLLGARARSRAVSEASLAPAAE